MDDSTSSAAKSTGTRESDEAALPNLEEDAASSVKVHPHRADQIQDSSTRGTEDMEAGKLQGNHVDTQQAKFCHPTPACSSDDEDVQILRVVTRTPRDENNVPTNHDFYSEPPQVNSDGHNADGSQIVISTDASLRHTAGGSCAILNDITFGTQTKAFSIEPANDSTVAELVTMTAAVRWGCQLVEMQRRHGDSRISNLQVVCDCLPAVQWWNGPKPFTAHTMYPSTSAFPRSNEALPPSRFDHDRDALNVAKRAMSLGLGIKAVWQPACSTIGIQLADWLSRLVKDFEVVVLRGCDVTDLSGLKFDFRTGMSLPNGRVASVRYMGQFQREKIGFNFHQLVSRRREVPQIVGAKRKYIPESADPEHKAEKKRIYIVISDDEEDDERGEPKEKPKKVPKKVQKDGESSQVQHVVSSEGRVRQYVDLTLD